MSLELNWFIVPVEYMQIKIQMRQQATQKKFAVEREAAQQQIESEKQAGQ